MSTEDNMDLVRLIVDKGLNTGDTGFADEVFSEYYVVHARDMNLSTGPEAFVSAVSFWRRSFPDLHCTTRHLVAQGEYVAHRYEITGTHTGRFGSWEPTGHRVRITGIDMHRIVRGLVVESWLSDDIPRALVDIGALPPATAG